MASMRHERGAALKRFSAVFFGTRTAAVVSTLFVVAAAVPIYSVYHEIMYSERVVLPLGDKTPPRARLALDVPTEILVIGSYHVGHEFGDAEMLGILETLKAASPLLQPRIEYLDTKYYPEKEHYDRFAALIERKYGSKRLPVVMVTDDPALDFALTYRAALFPAAAIVFCGINDYTPQHLAGQQNVTGIAEALAVGETLAIALALHPLTKTIYLLDDHTATGIATRHNCEEPLTHLARQVDVHDVDPLTRRELVGLVRALPADSLILVLSYSVFGDGEVISHHALARLLSDSSRAPVYGLHEELLGYGIVGGRLLAGRSHGAAAAELALRILAGEPAASIPVVKTTPTRVMFDDTELERFGVRLDELPAGSIVVNRPVPFIERHFYLVVSTVLVILILTTAIVALGLNMGLRLRAQRIIEQQMATLETKNAELERFTYTASHDLKSPLITIKGFLGMLVGDAKAGRFARMESDIARIEGAADKMQILLDDLLELSRIGRVIGLPADFSMTAVAEEAIELLHGTVQTEGGEIVVAADMPTVYADQRRVREVLQNLIENAHKFTRPTATPHIEVGWRAEAEGPVFFVKDNGLGLEPRFFDKIFGLFDKLDPASPGTGIGLALVKRIVELHNGRIWVESEGLGKGATFCFTLPDTRRPMGRKS